VAQTQRQAQRGLDFRSPWLSLFAAAVALVAFGAVWLSVRGQHPYTGPTAVALVVLYAVVLIRIGTVVSAFAGPRGVWLSDGVGCCIVLLGYSAAQAWLLRAPRSDA
jgi:hypothetical protein